MLKNKTTGKTISKNIKICNTFMTRLVGLMGRKSLDGDEGIYLDPCNQIHMFFMKFAIDVVFVDRDLRVVHITGAIKPWRISGYYSKARAAFELPAGFSLGVINKGDILELANNE